MSMAKVVAADLHLSRPLDDFVNAKLQRAGTLAKTVHDVVAPITQEAEFPDLRGRRSPSAQRIDRE